MERPLSAAGDSSGYPPRHGRPSGYHQDIHHALIRVLIRTFANWSDQWLTAPSSLANVRVLLMTSGVPAVSRSSDSWPTAPPAGQPLPHEPLQRKGNAALQHLYFSRLSFFFVFFDFTCWLAYTRHPRTLQPAGFRLIWPRSLCSFVFIVLGPNDTLINLLIVYVSSVFFF